MEIRQLYKQGLSISEISRRFKIDRKTARKYAQYTHQPPYQQRQEVQPLLDPYKDYLKERLLHYDLSAQRLFMEIKQQGYSGSYSWLAAYVTQIKKDYHHQAILRFETLPGEQSQVDWGYLGELYDIEKRQMVRLYCFLMILGYSRTLYAEIFETMQFEHFLRAHNHAFLYFGGYTREILYDNLKSVVIKRALLAKDSDFNKKFMDFAGYYGFKPILCRPYKPNTKGKIENSVKFVKQNFYLGKEFSSLREANKKLTEWLCEVNQRQHATTFEKPTDRLTRETLISLHNKHIYDLTPYFWRKVSRDCFISYEGNFYSAPYHYAGKEVSIRRTGMSIDIIYRKDIIAQHYLVLGKGHFVRNPDHFKGLLEIRCKHRIRTPKKNKPITYYNHPHPAKTLPDVIITPHELTCYEKVISYELNNLRTIKRKFKNIKIN